MRYKKIILGLICLIIIAILILVASIRASALTYYFSSVSGDDSRSAAQAQNINTPWASISKVNSVWLAGTFAPGDFILFKRGETFYGSISVGESGGSSSTPITVGAYSTGANPVITGLKTITGWEDAPTPAPDGVYESDQYTELPSKLQVVLINGVLYSIGRWPDQTNWKVGVYRTINSDEPNVWIQDNSLPGTPDWDNATAVVHSSRWTIDNAKITSHVGTRLNLDYEHPFGMGYKLCDTRGCNGYFIQNHIKTLSKFGEWYHNPSTDKISMYFGGTSTASVTVQASTFQNLVVASGKSYITIDGLTFKGANDNAISFTSGTNNIIKNCEIIYSGKNGVFGSGTSNFLIDNNDILYSYNDGVRIGGCSNASTINNLINYTYFAAGMGESGNGKGNGVSNGNNSLVQYNTILNSGFIGIHVGKSPNPGNSSRILNNFIDTVCFVKDDGAGIYDFVGHGDPCADPPCEDYYVNYKQRIIGNIVTNMLGAGEGVRGTTTYLPSAGVYTDDGANNCEITGNVIGNGVGWGLLLHNTTNSTVTGNTVYNAGMTQVYYDHDDLGWAVKDITTTGNVFFAKTSSQFTAFYYGTTMPTMVWNNNYYARPIAELSTHKHIKFQGTNYTLAGWKSASGKDANSPTPPTQTWPSPITPQTETRLEYNATKSIKVVALSGTYKDVQGNTYVCSITLQPFTGKVLIKTSPTVCAGNICPTVSLTSPANGSSSVEPATVQINATASDADGSIVKVEFLNGATILSTETTSPYEFTWTNVPVGNYSLTARATDNTGCVITSSARSITVTGAGNLPPTVSVTAPANNATYTSPATIQINADADDPDGSIASVVFYDDETILSTDNTSPYSFTWSNVPAGTKIINARATDNLGLTTKSATITVTVSNPTNQPPIVSLTAPANNTSYVAPATINMTATASDPDGFVTSVAFLNGEAVVGTDNSNPYSFSFSIHNPGTYQLKARATDNGGLTTTTTAITITVSDPDDVYPTVSLTSPTYNQTYTAPANIYILAPASDADGTISKVELYSGTTLLKIELGAPYEFNWTNVPIGNYSITAKAFDNSGNITTSTAIPITVTNALPVVNITAPLNNSSFLPSASIFFKATATDANGTISNVKFYAGSTLLQTEVTSPYEFTRGGFASGTYILTAVATDNNGGVKTSSPITFVVSSSNPTPIVTPTAPTEGQIFTSHTNIVLSADATDDGSIASVKFYDGATLLNTDNTAPYTFTYNDVSVGAKVITMTATDNLGAVGSAVVNISVVNISPEVSITSPSNGASYVAPGSIDIAASATDANGTITLVSFYNGGVLIGTDNTSPYTFTWTGVPTGSYDLTARATDNDGGIDTSAVVTVTSTNTVPTVSITATIISANPWSIHLEATATDANGTIATVDFYDGSTLLTTEDMLPYEWTITPAGAGTYTFTAVAMDNDSATTISNTVTLTLAAPTVSITSVVVTDNFTPGIVDIAATASDNVSVTKVDFYANGVLIGTDLTSPYTFSWTGIADGVYVISAIATDNDGATTATPNEAPIEILAGSVSITNLAQVYDGTPKPVDVTVDGGWPYDITYSDLLDPPTDAGSYDVVVTINDGIHFGSATETLVIAKSDSTGVLWPAPDAITYLTALSGTDLDATAGVAGTFVYTPPSGTVLGAGTQTLSVIFTPTDLTNYNKDTVTTNLIVNKAEAVLTITSAHTFVYDGTPKVATATVSPNFGIIKLTYNGSLIPPTQVGVYTIAVTLEADNYAADLVSGTLEITPVTNPGAVRNFLLLNRSKIVNIQ